MVKGTGEQMNIEQAFALLALLNAIVVVLAGYTTLRSKDKSLLDSLTLVDLVLDYAVKIAALTPTREDDKLVAQAQALVDKIKSEVVKQ